MVTTLQDISTHAAQPQGAQYRYDQLNRIKEMQVWQDMDVLNNQWQSSSALGDYRTSYRYDANGNILNLNRNGHNSVHLAMDSLSYHYISGTNRLAYVDDAVAAGNYSVDIDDQAVGNYAYDATGHLIKDVAEEIDSIVWTAYGKVLRVVRSSGSSKPDLHFAYGPDGNRLSKKAVYGNDSTVWTYYVRDAQGNTMATYKHKESSGVLHLTDHVMYGSSRLGSRERKHVELLGAGFSPITARAGIYGLERGDKWYALSNHLGNVLAVVSDRRAKASCADTLVRGYWADIMSTTDYYPFGMGMVERGDDGSYRYGFNGMQRDDEWQGAGNAYDFGARMYDGRLGRWMSVDAQFARSPSFNPYNFTFNSPTTLIDPDGNWIERIIKKYYRDKHGNLIRKTGFKGLFRRTVHKEITIRVHNAQLFAVDDVWQSPGDGVIELNQATLEAEAQLMQLELYKNFNKEELGRLDEIHPYNYQSDDGSTTANFKLEFVDPIKVISSLSDVEFGGKNDPTLFILGPQSLLTSLNNGEGAEGLAFSDELVLIDYNYSWLTYSSKSQIPSTSEMVGETTTHEFTHMLIGDALHKTEGVFNGYTPKENRKVNIRNIWNSDNKPYGSGGKIIVDDLKRNENRLEEKK